MANDFTARVAGISVELGMSVQNKSGIWCKPTVRMELKYMRGDLNETIERLNKLESKDGDKWEKFKWLIVAGLVTLILGYLAVSVGLK